MANRKRFIQIGVLCALLGLAAGWSIQSAGAQSSTILAVKPDLADVPLGNQVQLNLEVVDGVNVNAFDIMVNYDTQHLSMNSWAHGDYLTSLTCLNEVNQPGVLELACTQIAQQAVSGDGVLLELVFDTLAVGVGDVTITEAEFADSTGGKVLPDRRHGEVVVSGDPTYTLTPTVTQTATMTQTPTPTITWTGTSTPLLTVTPNPTSTAINAPMQTLTNVVTQGETERVYSTGTQETGEPVEESIILTETSSDQFVQSSKQPSGDTIKVDPTEKIKTQEASIEPITPTSKLTIEEMAESSSEQRLWDWLLWVSLLSAVIGLVVMVIVLIKRRKKQEEDLLL